MRSFNYSLLIWYCSLTLCLNLVNHYRKEKVSDAIFYKKDTGKPGVSLSTFVVGHVAVKKTNWPVPRYTGRRKDIV